MSELEVEKTGTKSTKVIKRYTNRKLYDTVDSRYVTLDEIAEMIKAGTEVQIVDNRTKEDLTSVTLAQIIFEEEKKQNQMPLSVLREIIRRPGESIQLFIQKEVTPRVVTFREEAESRIEKLLGRAGEEAKEGAQVKPAEGGAAATGGGNPAQELIKASQRTLEDWQRKVDERVKHVVEGVVGNLPAMGRDMQSLMSRLDALEKKLDELESKRK